MGLKWEAKTQGTPEGDAVKESEIFTQLKRGKYEIVEHEHWNAVKNLVVQERKRRGLDTSQVIAYIPPGEIKAEHLNNLLANSNIQGVYDDVVKPQDTIKNEKLGINDVVERITIAGSYCVCDCNYCACNCNQCTCNCDYSCTCDCAY